MLNFEHMNWNTKNNQRLIDAFMALKTAAEARSFLRDLLTEEEIIEFAKRLRAAELLSQAVPYTQIVKETGLSSTTVARVSKWLNRRDGGYKVILNRLAKHHHNPKTFEKGLG